MNPRTLFIKYLGWCPGVASASTFIPDREINNRIILASATVLLISIAVFAYLETKTHSSFSPESMESPIGELPIDWIRTFDLSDNPQALFDNNVGRNVLQTSDGGYIVVGYNETGQMIDQIYQVRSSLALLKIDPNGNIEWTKTCNEPGGSIGHSVIETNDGYIIAGSVNTSLQLMKINNEGDIIWDKIYENGFGASLKKVSDGEFAVLGTKDHDALLLKTDEFGNILWSKTYNENVESQGFSLQVTKDGGYLIGGITRGNPETSHWDWYIVKTDSMGNTIWSKTLGGSKGDMLYSIIETPDDGVLAVGNRVKVGTGGGAGDSDNWAVRMDKNGEVLWSKTYPGANGFCVIRSEDDNYVVLTRKAGSILLHKIDDKGEILWSLSPPRESDVLGNNIEQTFDGGYIITGSQTNITNQKDMILIKIPNLGPETK